ncbi:MAG: B12-binding domain-containing radical SAM protein [Myxococcota bacterium]
MHVLLIQPKVTAEPAYPLALAGMISLLHGGGHTVEGIDLAFEKEDLILSRIQSGDIDWVGATVLHHNAESVGQWMQKLRSFPDVQTFVAGALPTLDPMGAIARTGADFAIVGEPEESVADLIDARVPGRVPGVVRAGNAKPITRHPSPFAMLPLPDRTIFPVNRYSFAMRSMATPYAQVVTSRGCNRYCPYCPVPSLRPRGFDPKLPDQVIREWTALVNDHDIRSIHVEDDSFLADPDRVRSICAGLSAAKLDVQWELVNGIRPDQVDPVLLQTMADAGCTRVVFSFEHISTIDGPGIGQTMDESMAAVSAARDVGMRVGGYFIVGLPGMNIEQTVRSVLHGLHLRLDDANWVPFYETPGSGYANAATTIDATTLSKPISERIAKAAHLAFFGDPRTFIRLTSDLIATPGTIPSLAAKAIELLRAGGPVPMRDTP